MKSLIIGLIASTAGMGSSVLNHGEYLNGKSFLVTTYYQTALGSYTVNPPGELICTAESFYPCTLTYIFDPHVSGFLYASRPTSFHIASDALGMYE